ncbi:hypothetical protein EC12741_A0285 [Escherichia coli 1.2741]|nr:hypothetical protein EC12741_A0285 [Escherichia coli 1.2741]
MITFDIIEYSFPHYFPADKVFSVEIFYFQRKKNISTQALS